MIERQLVTDTHPLIYYFCDGGRKLSKKARRAFDEAVVSNKTIIYIPVPVLWELSMLVEGNKIRLPKNFSDWLQDLFAYDMINPLSFDMETVICNHNNYLQGDPFDRAIVATALNVGLPLITNDSAIHKYQPCELFWD